MKLIDLFRLSFTNLRGNRLRTILTVGGVGIGIGAIMFLVTLGFGMQRLTIDKITQSSALTTLDVNVGSSSILKLNDQTIDKIKTLEHVSSISPIISLPCQATFQNTTTDCAIKGVDKQFIELEGLKITPEKLFLPFVSAAESQPTVIISSGLQKLFEINDVSKVMDQVFSFNIFIQKGEEKTSEMQKEVKKFRLAGTIQDEIPLAYVDFQELKILGINNYNTLKVKVDEAANMASVKAKIEELGFNVTSVVDLIDQIKSIFRVVEGVLAGFGIIALLVASIGMFNTMTIALLERTRDIGIMKAIGARKKDISRMFITEAALIGLSGGIFGVLGGWLLGQTINGLINGLAKKAGGEAVSLFYTPWQFVALVIGFAFLVGIITGLYPARRAAKINSLDALRYE